MNNPDFDEIAALWKQEPSPAERRLFQHMARRSGQWGRALEQAHVGIGVLLVLGILIALVSAPEPATVAIAALAIAAIIWSTLKRQTWRRVAEMLDTGDRAAFLSSAERRAEAELRRSAFGIVLLPPALLLGALLRYSHMSGGSLEGFFDAAAASVAGSPWRAILVGALGIFYLFMIARHLRLGRELRGVRTLDRAYREQAVSEESGAAI